MYDYPLWKWSSTSNDATCDVVFLELVAKTVLWVATQGKSKIYRWPCTNFAAKAYSQAFIVSLRNFNTLKLTLPIIYVETRAQFRLRPEALSKIWMMPKRFSIALGPEALANCKWLIIKDDPSMGLVIILPKLVPLYNRRLRQLETKIKRKGESLLI